MKPVEVTVGMSSDDLAIEACFERSFLCNLDGAEDGDLSTKSDDPIMMARTNNSIVSKTYSADTNNVEVQSGNTTEEIRDDGVSTREERTFLSQSDVRETHSHESFNEARKSNNIVPQTYSSDTNSVEIQLQDTEEESREDGLSTREERTLLPQPSLHETHSHESVIEAWKSDRILSKMYSIDTNNVELEIRDDGVSARPGRTVLAHYESDVQDTHSDDNFIEAEFEMVLDIEKSPGESETNPNGNDENLATKIPVSDGDENRPAKLEVSGDIDQENDVSTASGHDENVLAKVNAPRDEEEEEVIFAASQDNEKLLAKVEESEEKGVGTTSDDNENLLTTVEASHDDEEEKVVVWSAEADAQVASRSIDSEMEEVQEVQETNKDDISNDDVQDITCNSDAALDQAAVDSKLDHGQSDDNEDQRVESLPEKSSQTPELSPDEKMLVDSEGEARDDNVDSIVADQPTIAEDTLHRAQSPDEDDQREQSSAETSSHETDTCPDEAPAVDHESVCENHQTIEIVEESPLGFGTSFFMSLGKTFGWTIKANDSGHSPSIECQSNLTSTKHDEEPVAADTVTDRHNECDHPFPVTMDVAPACDIASSSDDDIVPLEIEKEGDVTGAKSDECEPCPSASNSVDVELTTTFVESETPRECEPHGNENIHDANEAFALAPSGCTIQDEQPVGVDTATDSENVCDNASAETMDVTSTTGVIVTSGENEPCPSANIEEDEESAIQEEQPVAADTATDNQNVRDNASAETMDVTPPTGDIVTCGENESCPAANIEEDEESAIQYEQPVAADTTTDSQNVRDNASAETMDVTPTTGVIVTTGDNEARPAANNEEDEESTTASVESETSQDSGPDANEKVQGTKDVVVLATSGLTFQETSSGKELTVVASMKPTSLSTLINQRDWVSVMERMKSIADLSVNSTDIQGHSFFSDNDSLGDFFLHEICKNKPSAEVVQQWLKIKSDDAEKPGIAGHLPLHYACWFGASIGAVDALVEAFPEALTKPDDHDKMLPLHYACREGADASVLEFLLMAYPEATLVQDKNGMTPMDHAMNLQDHVVRNQTVNSIQHGLKQNLSALSTFIAKSKAEMLEEREVVKKLEIELETTNKRAQEDRSTLECALLQVEALEKSESDKATEIDDLRQKIETLESQLAETHQLLAAEKKRAAGARDLESALKIEQCKNSALAQSLAAKQEMLANEKERTKDAEQKLSEVSVLLQKEQEASNLLSEQLNIEQEKRQMLEQEQANRLAEEKQQARDNSGNSERADPSLAEEIKAENDQKLELESIRQEIEAKMEENQAAINALEISNVKKQELLDVQQEKVEYLERVHREKELILQKSQEIMKSLEDSIDKKLSLQKSEEEKIRQLEQLRQKKREMIESEEELVRKLDYTLGRKQALLELEQMKEKTLQQTIARKNALLEAEMNKVKEIEKLCAEREALLASEQNMVKSLSASKAEKENLLKAERELVDDLYRVHSEKEALLEMKRNTEEEMTKKVKHLEVLLANEKKLFDEIERVRKEKHESLVTTENALKVIEERTLMKSQLLNKEQDITECLERFRTRRNQIVSSGRVYSFMDATLCLSHLVKEAFLANQHDKRLIEARKEKESVIVPKESPPAPATLLRKAISTQGKRYISHFAGYLGISPAIRRKYFR